MTKEEWRAEVAYSVVQLLAFGIVGALLTAYFGFVMHSIRMEPYRRETQSVEAAERGTVPLEVSDERPAQADPLRLRLFRAAPRGAVDAGSQGA